MGDFPDDAKMKRIANGLWNAATMSADALAAKKGEGDLFVQIKRNSERLQACDRHEFEPQPDWRSKGPGVSRQKARCARCGGEMNVSAAMDYLRGFAHGSGQSFKAMTDAIWPPAQPDTKDTPDHG